MTIYELYIDGILCDLPSDEAVTLLYQSPIFSSLDSIQSNRSYNIGLPPTPANMRAIGQAARPDVDADAPYVRLPAALYQDGVSLFTQGFAVVTDISDTINVTLTWGNVDNFQPLFDSNLRDLNILIPAPEGAEGDWVPYIEWNENTAILEANTSNKYPDVAFWGINFGMGLSNPKYLHPSVQVSAILDHIEEYNGITIDGKDRLAYSKNLGPIVPLVSKNGDEESGKAEITICSLSQATSNGQTILKGTNPTQHPEYVNGDYFDVKNAQGIDMQMTISGFLFSSDDKDIESLKMYVAPSEDYNTVLADMGFAGINQGDRIYIYGTPHVEIPQDKIPESGYVAIVVKHEKRVELGGDMSFYAYPREEVHFPSVFPIAPNLPDMSQGDFILALMSMNGLFAYADKDNPNTIKLISIDDIIAKVRKNDIIDWSDRVILNDIHRVDMPDASAFTIDDLAQSNILDYDNDDDVKTDTYGTITIRNENIEKETELVSLPFSASENTTTDGVDCAVVPIYEDDGKGGANYSECSPRILSGRGAFMSGVARCIGVFDPWMKFGGEEGIVKTRYASYQKVVDRLRMISVRAKLTALDLYNLDYTRPVYIAQFGQLFAIFSVETGEDGICDCQLLKLKADGVAPVKYYLWLNGEDADQNNTNVPAGGTRITHYVESDGTPYVVSKDSRLTADITYGPDGALILVIVVPKNSTAYNINYTPVVVGIREDDSVRRRVNISQLGAGYTLVLNGSVGDLELDARATAGQLKVAYETNGTLQLSKTGDVVAAMEADAANINIYTYGNTSGSPRTGVVTVSLKEAPDISRRITINQAGAAYNPSVSFSKGLPLDKTTQTVAITNNGDVDLQILTLPEFIGGTSLPYDLAQTKILTLGVYANSTGRLRTGTIAMRYRGMTGEYIDYSVEISQQG